MKLRKEKSEITDAQEREAVEAITELSRMGGSPEQPEPSSVYFSSLMVRTNNTIDRVTSGKALSMSWLARVAVPGVVAILFFFIGLHYYVPQKQSNSVAEVVKSLSDEEIDSLAVVDISHGSTSGLQHDPFDVSSDQLAEFYVSSISPTLVMESLSEQQQKEVAAILEARFT
ncbi:MAG: hypothetical protein ABI623_09135, partial [bacterium]